MLQTYQLAVRMMANTPNMMEGFEVHVVEDESREALPLTKVTEFWIAIVSTFGFFYEAIVTSVYSKHYTANFSLSNVQRYLLVTSSTHSRELKSLLNTVYLKKATNEPMTYVTRLDKQWKED